MPVFESTTDDGTSFGALTSGFDIVGRHSYTVEALRNNRFHENSAWLWYRYAGLGLPLIDLYASQNFAHDIVFAGTSGNFTRVGTISERSRIASLQATLIRPRFRNYALASFGAETESIRYFTAPDTLLPRLSPFYRVAHTYPALIASAGWSNVRRPGLSISAEDGISASVSGRQRWQRGTSGSSTRSVIGVTSAYRSRSARVCTPRDRAPRCWRSHRRAESRSIFGRRNQRYAARGIPRGFAGSAATDLRRAGISGERGARDSCVLGGNRVSGSARGAVARIPLHPRLHRQDISDPLRRSRPRILSRQRGHDRRSVSRHRCGESDDAIRWRGAQHRYRAAAGSAGENSAGSGVSARQSRSGGR